MNKPQETALADFTNTAFCAMHSARHFFSTLFIFHPFAFPATVHVLQWLNVCVCMCARSPCFPLLFNLSSFLDYSFVACVFFGHCTFEALVL